MYAFYNVISKKEIDGILEDCRTVFHLLEDTAVSLVLKNTLQLILITYKTYIIL